MESQGVRRSSEWPAEVQEGVRRPSQQVFATCASSSPSSALAVVARKKVADWANRSHSALASDTGGSTRLPSSFCGIYGLKPSYGLLSRHGLVSYASSLDTVGVMGREMEGVWRAFGAS